MEEPQILTIDFDSFEKTGATQEGRAAVIGTHKTEGPMMLTFGWEALPRLMILLQALAARAPAPVRSQPTLMAGQARVSWSPSENLVLLHLPLPGPLSFDIRLTRQQAGRLAEALGSAASAPGPQ